jgi:hypothetical protein
MYKKLFDRDVRAAAMALVMLLYAVAPMFAFGSLLGAIGLHPDAAAALADELPYRFAMWWLGGMKGVGIWFALAAVGSMFCGIERVFRAITEQAEPTWMPRLRGMVKDYTLKPFLSALAFVDGLVVHDLRLCLAIFAMGVVLSFWSLHLLKASES